MTPLLFGYLYIILGFSGILLVVLYAWLKDGKRKDKK